MGETNVLSFQELVANSRHLGVYPDAMISLLEIMEDPLVDADTLLPIVQTDQGLTAGLLKICNSPLFGLRREVGSVKEALVRLGNLAFARLAFLVSVDRMLQCDLPAYRLGCDEIRNHGLAVGYAASRLSAAAGRADLKLAAFTAGILHDCGKVLLDEALGASIPPEARGGDGRLDPAFEIAMTGYDHAKAGAGLLSYWGMPQVIVQAVRCHHRVDAAGGYRDLTSIVWGADTVVHLAGSGIELDPEDPDSPYAMFLDHGIDVAAVQDMIDGMPNERQELLALAARG